jgi:PKD repeat protein
VALRVTDNNGATDTVIKTVTIGQQQSPQASFTFSPSSPSIPDAVQFTDSSSDPDGSISSWCWDFGDGSSSTERNPTHRYTEKRTFTVALTVTDNDGLTDTKTDSITVTNISPTASFTFFPERPYINQPVSFDASDSMDKDGTITSYSWDFDGDGRTDAEGEEATWTFTEAGTFTVTLTVTDDDGATSVQEAKITVVSQPSGPPRFEDLWAVVIGVGEYEDSRLDLGLPEDDAQAVYDFLVNNQGGGFPKDHVRLLVNEEATRKGIEQAWGWLLQQAGKEDLVLVYFSGHGGHEHDYNGDEPEGDTEDEYLLPYDTDPSDLFSTAVRDDAVGDWVSSLRSEHVILIFDSCHSGGAAKTVKAYENPGSRAGPGNTVFTDLMGVDGVLIMTACQATELAQQDDNLGYGVFTYFLLTGLGGLENAGAPAADTDQDGRVTVEELKSYLQREVPQYVSDVMHRTSPQNPLITGDEALSRVALSGYGVPLIGEVTAIDEERVIITLGSRHGIQPEDRFEVIHVLELPDGQTMEEHRAIIEVLYVLGPNRSACRIVETIYPIELRDQVRPIRE